MSRVIKHSVIRIATHQGQISQVGIATSANPMLPIKKPATRFADNVAYNIRDHVHSLTLRDRLRLLIRECGYAGKFFTREELESGATAGRDMRDLVGDAGACDG